MPNGDTSAGSDQDAGQSGDAGRSDRTALLIQRARALAQEDTREAAQELLAMLAGDEQLLRWQVVDSMAELAGRLKRRQKVRWTAAFSSAAPVTFDELVALVADGLREPSLDREAVAFRVALAEAMGLWHDEAVTPVLVEALEDDLAPIVRATAATALGRVHDQQALDALMTALSDASFWVQRAAADALGAIGDVRAVPALRQALLDLEQADETAVDVDPAEIEEPPLDVASPEEASSEAPGVDAAPRMPKNGAAGRETTAALVKGSLISALGNLDAARARSTLIHYTEDPSPEIRWRAARGLAQIGDASALPALRLLLQDEAVYFGRPVSQVAELAIEAINKDERGLGSLLRKGFFFAWHAVRRRLTRR